MGYFLSWKTEGMCSVRITKQKIGDVFVHLPFHVIFTIMSKRTTGGIFIPKQKCANDSLLSFTFICIVKPNSFEFILNWCGYAECCPTNFILLHTHVYYPKSDPTFRQPFSKGNLTLGFPNCIFTKLKFKIILPANSLTLTIASKF